MRTTFDLVDALYKKISGGPTDTEANGKVYKWERPAGSTKEDSVLNSLPVNNELLQESILNWNIFVPNKPVDTGGIISTSLPDLPRLKQLTALAVQEVKDIWIDELEMGFFVQQQMFFSNGDTEWYSNIRLQSYNINT